MIVAAVALAAAAAPVVIPFAPPLGRPLFFETEQTRITSAGPQRYRMVNRLLFAQAPEGWRLTLTLVDISASARADTAALFDAAMRPFMDVDVVMTLDGRGTPMRVANADAVWARVTAALRASADALATRSGGEGAMVKATRQHFEQFAALSGQAREDKLMETAEQLIGFALPALAPGGTAPWQIAVSGGPSADGTIRLIDATPRHADYAITTRTPLPDGRALEDRTSLTVDRATGLVSRSRTEKRLGTTILADETVHQIGPGI